jgi:hypothetical protein
MRPLTPRSHQLQHPYKVYSTASGCGEYLYDLFLCPVADKTSDNDTSNLSLVIAGFLSSFRAEVKCCFLPSFSQYLSLPLPLVVPASW